MIFFVFLAAFVFCVWFTLNVIRFVILLTWLAIKTAWLLGAWLIETVEPPEVEP